MAFSKARRLSDSISATGEVSAFVDGAIVAADLNSTLDLTGKTITVANASTGDSDTTVANTAFVQQEIAALVASAPGTLNTLNELAAALGDDASFSTTITNSIATKLPLAGGTLTGALVTSDLITANTARIIIQRSNDDSSIVFANNASGTPSSHTWAAGLNYSNSNEFSIAYASNGLPSLEASKLVISTSGNVGIGTAAPNQDGFGSSSRVLTVKASSNGGTGALELIGLSGSSGDLMSAINFMSQAVGNPAARITGLRHTSDDEASIAFDTSGAERMRITQAGRVGIGDGTTAPASQLHIESGNAHNKISVTSTASGGTGYDAAIDLLGSATNSECAINMGINGDADREAIKTYQSAMTFRTNNTERMRINNAGIITLPYQPCFDAAGVASGDNSQINFTTTFTNVGSHYSTSTFRFTAPVAGSYLFYTNFIKNNQSTTTNRRRFLKNGSVVNGGRHIRLGGEGGNDYDWGSMSQILSLALGDYVTVDHYAGNAFGNNEYDAFGGYLIG